MKGQPDAGRPLFRHFIAPFMDSPQEKGATPPGVAPEHTYALKARQCHLTSVIFCTVTSPAFTARMK